MKRTDAEKLLDALLHAEHIVVNAYTDWINCQPETNEALLNKVISIRNALCENILNLIPTED